jgi:hypothetical protein
MTQPIRHQMPPRNQRKGWRKPANSKVVTRASRWGNPYKTIKDGGTYTLQESLAAYRRDLFSDEGVQARPDLPRITIRDAMDELRGYDLVCGCDLDQGCHADLLISVANIPWGDAPASGDTMTVVELDQLSHCFRDENTWGQGFSEFIEARNRLQPMLPHTLAYSRAVAAFCHEHRLVPGHGQTLNWFGYGSVPLAFDDEADEDGLKTLMWMEDFSAVSGISCEDLILFWMEEEEDERSDIYSISYEYDGRPITRYLFGHSAAMRAMTFLSPWRHEFYEQTKEMMSHAMAKSGLGQMLMGGDGSGFTAIAHMTTVDGQALTVAHPIHSFNEDNVPIVRPMWEDAEDELIPITDMCETYEVVRSSDAAQNILGPRVSEEEALKMAFRGPAVTPDA